MSESHLVINQPYIRVAVPLPLTGLFTYQVPAHLRVMVGQAVRVPFGKRTLTGYVIEGLSQPDVSKTRPIIGLVDPNPVIDPERIRLCRWAADYYLSGIGEMIATALPSTYRAKSKRLYFPEEPGIERIGLSPETSSEELMVLREVIRSPGLTASGLARRLHGEVERPKVRSRLTTLLRKGHIRAEDVSGTRSTGTLTYVRLVPKASIPRGARMRSILQHLEASGGELELSALTQLEGSNISESIRRLEENGWVQREQREDRRAVMDANASSQSQRPTLNEQQVAAVNAILTLGKGVLLLCGITGSGKTEVYLHAVEAILAHSKQALVLVPEIALTPQLTQRFFSRFGDQIAVLHSGLNPSERLREWRRIRAGEAQIAIGARSALFAPFNQLGLVIVDEEHDDSYKQDDGVRYHARDLAVLRGAQLGCPVVLGSATPSMETWWNAQQGRYKRVDLSVRATPAPLPQISIIDTRGQTRSELLHPDTYALLNAALTSGNKAIVLYNRRGYAPVVECPGCGAHFQCPSCGIGMVLHRQQRRITCHHCGFHRPFQPDCTTCGSTFDILGHGTQRVEETLSHAFPNAPMFRMDADSTRAKGSHAKILADFRRSDSGILVGTQLVAKGHDFPDIQAAVVLGVDHILNMPDFRSAERTFSLVTQLAGRAGRSANGGKVIVQTRHPDHFVFRLLKSGHGLPTLDAFMESDARLRDTMGHPPMHRLILLKVEGADRSKTVERAAEITRSLRKQAQSASFEIGIAGPVAAPLAKLVGRWRFQIVIRGPKNQEFRNWLAEQQPQIAHSHGRGIRVAIDVDPRSLL